AAERRLIDRGWLHPDGSFTDAGRAGRDAVEDTTNALAFEPIRRLGAGGLDRLRELMLPLIDRLRAGGAVLGRWPPPRLHRWDE
ncbi:MAG TPA: hypothetical protein VHL09_03175, partial [Dehalococcoidia bacterium]|nr:hypothetical protein [Dehalococcoidia bacterium]